MRPGKSSANVSSNLSQNGEALTIAVIGNFDFSLVRAFREAYSDMETNPEKVIIDLQHTNTIDSTALGMLLNMKKHLNKTKNQVDIINCSPTVKRIFSIARFDTLFHID